MEIYYNIENWDVDDTGFITVIDPSIPQKKKGLTAKEYSFEMNVSKGNVAHIGLNIVTLSKKVVEQKKTASAQDKNKVLTAFFKALFDARYLQFTFPDYTEITRGIH
jgi:hypothetical protein